jgi:cob(I)alamin adenosyltransferase
MGKRLSVIATRTGDDGSTGLGDGARTRKDSPRIRAIGEIDELNSLIGALIGAPMSGPMPVPIPAAMRAELLDIQHDLFDLGGELCLPGHSMLQSEQVARLDALLARYHANLPRLEEFVLPGGSPAAAQAHVCRAVCRRAERALVELGASEPLRAAPRQYINRLSDLLFVLARVLNRLAGGADVQWRQRKNQAPAA